MSISLPQRIIKQATHPVTVDLHKSSMIYKDEDREVDLIVQDMPDEAIHEVLDLIKEDKAFGPVTRMLNSVLRVRAGEENIFISNLKAFSSMLIEYMKKDIINGWIFKREHDGRLYPFLLTDVRYSPPSRDQKGRVTLYFVSYKQSTRQGSLRYDNVASSESFYGEDAVRRTINEALLAKGYEKETPELIDAYHEEMAYWNEHVSTFFAEQFVVTGAPLSAHDHHVKRGGVEMGSKVILDTDASHYSAKSNGYAVNWNAKKQIGTFALDRAMCEGELSDDSVSMLPIPEHPVVQVFDLRLHKDYAIHASHLKRYEYDANLKDKLVLPESHRDLLNILTTDLDAFIDDIIEGKSAGNVILCQGKPGVGKTLTAEIYSEVIKRPLYSVHSGTLGTTASQIESRLKEVFKSARRWNAVLLLDEADVFVVERGNNIEQNAIVAEFLRTLEYFDGLMFMTTNRSNAIDEAIISRCAAIIQYEPPQNEDLAAVWRVMSTQFQANMSEELISALLPVFVNISPRDIKMLLRLALRVSKFHDEPLSVELFKKCAVFRAIQFSKAAPKAA